MEDKIYRENAYGVIVQYNQVTQKRTANHIANPMSSSMLKSNMNRELVNRNVDGWCDEVVVVQHTLTDDVYFYGYVAATESASPDLVIPLWAILAFILAATATAWFGLWLLYLWGTAVLEKAVPTNRYTTEEGEQTTSFTEYVTLQRKYYWLVCPNCGMGFASKIDYPTWEQIPEDIHTSFQEHVKNCTGIKKEEAYPWLAVVAVFAVVVTVVGVAYVGSQALKGETPTIIVR